MVFIPFFLYLFLSCKVATKTSRKHTGISKSVKYEEEPVKKEKKRRGEPPSHPPRDRYIYSFSLCSGSHFLYFLLSTKRVKNKAHPCLSLYILMTKPFTFPLNSSRKYSSRNGKYQ